MKSPSRLADLSLNWVIRDSSPKLTLHSITHASWLCSGTWLCTKTVATSGSSPTAKQHRGQLERCAGRRRPVPRRPSGRAGRRCRGRRRLVLVLGPNRAAHPGSCRGGRRRWAGCTRGHGSRPARYPSECLRLPSVGVRGRRPHGTLRSSGGRTSAIGRGAASSVGSDDHRCRRRARRPDLRGSVRPAPAADPGRGGRHPRGQPGPHRRRLPGRDRAPAALDLDVATEFLLIAATLVELKARRLLPGDDDVDLDDELALWEERDLLLARLLECKTFKDVSRVFGALADDADRSVPAARRRRRALRRPRSRPARRADPAAPARCGDHGAHARSRSARIDLFHVAPIRVSVADAVAELVDELSRVGRITFARLTASLVERLDVIVRFLAVLELFKQGLVELDQADRFGDIRIEWRGGDDPDAGGDRRRRLRRMTLSR